MASDDHIQVEGVITDAGRAGIFKVLGRRGEIEMDLVCKPSGKIRMNRINLVVGDKVLVNVSPYDLTRGVIIRRLK